MGLKTKQATPDSFGDFKFKMWQTVQDQRTGFRGIIIGRAEYGDELDQYFVANYNGNGTENNQQWIVESRLSSDMVNSTIKNNTVENGK